MRALTIRKEIRREDTRPCKIPCLVEPLQLLQRSQLPQLQHSPQLPAQRVHPVQHIYPAPRLHPALHFHSAPLRPKRKGFLNSHSPHLRCYYCKNRTPRGYSARSAEAAICGSRWNYYLSYGKTIPDHSHLEHLVVPVTTGMLNNSHNGAETSGEPNACGVGRQIYFSLDSHAVGYHSHAPVAAQAGQDYWSCFQPTGQWAAAAYVPAGNYAVQTTDGSAAHQHAATEVILASAITIAVPTQTAHAQATAMNGGAAYPQATRHETETAGTGGVQAQAGASTAGSFSSALTSSSILGSTHMPHVQHGSWHHDSWQYGGSQTSWSGSASTPQAGAGGRKAGAVESPVPATATGACARAVPHDVETAGAGTWDVTVQAGVPAQAVFSSSSMSSTHVQHGSWHHGSGHQGNGHATSGSGGGVSAAAIETWTGVSGPALVSQLPVMDVTLAISYNPLSQLSYMPTYQVGIDSAGAPAQILAAAGMSALQWGMAVEAAVAGTMSGGTGLQVGHADSQKRGFMPKVVQAADAMPE